MHYTKINILLCGIVPGFCRSGHKCIVTRFAKTGHNSAFAEIHFIAPLCFGH